MIGGLGLARRMAVNRNSLTISCSWPLSSFPPPPSSSSPPPPSSFSLLPSFSPHLFGFQPQLLPSIVLVFDLCSGLHQLGSAPQPFGNSIEIKYRPIEDREIVIRVTIILIVRVLNSTAVPRAAGHLLCKVIRNLVTSIGGQRSYTLVTAATVDSTPSQALGTASTEAGALMSTLLDIV